LRNNYIIIFFKKLYYFLSKDILIWKSYKLQALIGVFSGFFGLIKFGLIGRFISGGNYFPMIEKYNGDIIIYFITGTVFMSFTSLALSSFKSVIRQEQVMGTIEYLLLSKTKLWEVFIFTILSRFLFALLNTTITFLFLIYIFQSEIKQTSKIITMNNGVITGEYTSNVFDNINDEEKLLELIKIRKKII